MGFGGVGGGGGVSELYVDGSKGVEGLAHASVLGMDLGVVACLSP